MLTFKSILNEATSKKERKALLANKVEDMLNTVIRQIAFFQFEKEVHTQRKNSELSTRSNMFNMDECPKRQFRTIIKI